MFRAPFLKLRSLSKSSYALPYADLGTPRFTGIQFVLLVQATVMDSYNLRTGLLFFYLLVPATGEYEADSCKCRLVECVATVQCHKWGLTSSRRQLPQVVPRPVVQLIHSFLLYYLYPFNLICSSTILYRHGHLAVSIPLCIPGISVLCECRGDERRPAVGELHSTDSAGLP